MELTKSLPMRSPEPGLGCSQSRWRVLSGQLGGSPVPFERDSRLDYTQRASPLRSLTRISLG